MIVECPACHTQYRVDDALVAGKDPLLQCPLDECLFKLPSSPTARTRSADSLTEASVSFSLADEEPEPTQQQDKLVLSTPDLSAEEEEPILPPTKGGKLTSFSLRPFFVFLVALALSYGTFSLYLLIHPGWTRTFLVRLPLVGTVFVADQLSFRKINLINLEGRYQRIKNNKRAFIISGQAVNAAPIAAYSIQVEGRIFNSNGEVKKKIIFCGNEVSIKVVENLSSQELSLLQKLVPPKRFGVLPGRAASFLIIFTNPPADIKEFSCRVVVAQYGPHDSVFQRQKS